MTLNQPFRITSRLLPGLQVGNAWIQLEYSKRAGDNGRTRYAWTVDITTDGKEQTFTGDDLQSGCGGGSLQAGFESLLSFLAAAGSSVNYGRRSGRLGDNADLFPELLSDWAALNEDELTMLEMELQETSNLIEE